MTFAPYGSWKSPVTTDLIVAGSIGVSSPCFAGGIQYWAESRPQEGGRIVVVRRDADGSEHDLFAAPFNARTRVHEYGGDAWLIHDGLVYFSNFADQQVHVAGDGEPRPLTHTEGLRFANGVVDARRNRIIYVIEDHRAPGEAVNRIGAVDLVTGDVTMLCEGHDFYSSPALDADAKRLAFIAWDHPNMPWDETLLYVADLDASGLAGEPVCIAGESEALQQPRFAPNGNLVYISDRSGWWNLYEVDADGQHRALCPMEAEFGVPLWAFGASTYDF
ncbi:MAG: hypothetical protein KDI19_09020, partial [Pseudomonadales bacterium]|nr:hypothetical protein [Pseudomonadales bacterium]